MARSIETIVQEGKTIGQSKPALTGFNWATPSQVSEFMSWLEMTANLIHNSEVILDATNLEISNRIEAQEPATRPWYQSRCFEFQLGDQLQDDGTYAIIDTNKQIITRCAVIQETNGTLTIKVAKGDVGEEVALSSNELQQFTNYLEQVKAAGTIISVISLNADELVLTGDIYYDGLLDLSVIQTRVQDALNTFLATGLDFNGDLLVNKIMDTLQAVDGVNDAQFSEVKVIVGVFETVVDRVYTTSAGYLKESPDFNFLDTLTFIPQ